MELNTVTDKGGRGTSRPRIIGLDIARALAIIGMVLAHLATPPGIAGELTSGIPSALFAVLAGVSLGLIAKPGNILVRGVVLIVLGLALQPLSGTIQVVLTAMGIGFVVLHRAPRWSTRTLAVLALVAATIGIGIHAYAATTENWNLALMLVTGGYPIFTWITYLLVGLVAGRVIVEKRATWLPVMAVGAVLAAGGLALRGTQLPGALDATSHSGGLVDLVTTCASSLAVIAACLLCAGRWAAPLQAFGSMSLTMYIAHLLTGGRLLAQPQDAHFPAAAVTTILAGIAFAMVWKMLVSKRGPAEWVLAKLAGLPARAGARAAKVGAGAAVAALAVLPAPAHAIENGQPAEGAHAQAVGRMHYTGATDSDCTTTAIAERWFLTARHCIDGVADTSGHVTLGNDGATRDIGFDRAIHAPAGDIALLHTTAPVGLAQYPTLADEVPASGTGTVYGWSSDGMGGTGVLPQATAKITELANFSLYGGEGSTMLGELQNGAVTQPGDSGGPLFLGGTIAGVASVAIGSNDANTTSGEAAYSPVAEQGEWIRKQIAHDEILPETLAAQDPLPRPVEDISWWWALLAGLTAVGVAVPYYRRAAF